METKITSQTTEVIISPVGPTVLIGERINPTGKKKLSAALEAGDLELVRQEAKDQVQAGADILDVNVGAAGVDETVLLPEAVEAVMEAVEAPLCLDSNHPKALEAALKVYKGKALVNSVNGEERSLAEILPLVKEYGAAVVGLTIDDDGIANEVEKRFQIAEKIVERAAAMGIPPEDVVIDSLAMAVGADTRAGLVTLEVVAKIRDGLGVNQTLGASNISFGLPDRRLLTGAFLALAIGAGVTCPIVEAAKVRPIVLAADLALGRDDYARRYTQAFRQRQSG